MLIKNIDSLLELYWNDENKISHLDEIINKNKNVSVNDFHKNTEKKRSHIIHKNTMSTMLKKKQKSKSILIMLTERLELLTDVTITNKTIDCFIHVWLSVYSENKFKTFFTI